jgi:hypothetical protein
MLVPIRRVFGLFGKLIWTVIGIVVNGNYPILLFLVPWAALMLLAIKRVLWTKGDK